MARILVTRPETDAPDFLALCRERGHEPIFTPLMQIRFIAGGTIPFDGIQALAITSANGVRAFARLEPRRDLAVYAVGAASAAVAREFGFTDVHEASGDVGSLARLIATKTDAARGAFLHPCGQVLAGDLAGLLAASGHIVRQEVLYAAEPVDALPQALILAAQEGKGVVTLFSPRTARILLGIAERVDFSALDAAVLSLAVAEALLPMRFRRVLTAAAPRADALLDAIEAALSA